MDTTSETKPKLDPLSELVQRALTYTAPPETADEETRDKADLELVRIAKLEYVVREMMLSAKLYRYDN